MSIRAIARDLYRAQQKVSRLEQEIETVSMAAQGPLQDELRQARQELVQLKRMLEGEKESSSFRQKFQGFGR